MAARRRWSALCPRARLEAGFGDGQTRLGNGGKGVGSKDMGKDVSFRIVDAVESRCADGASTS
jgi:hypothetical protein